DSVHGDAAARGHVEDIGLAVQNSIGYVGAVEEQRPHMRGSFHAKLPAEGAIELFGQIGRWPTQLGSGGIFELEILFGREPARAVLNLPQRERGQLAKLPARVGVEYERSCGADETAQLRRVGAALMEQVRVGPRQRLSHLTPKWIENIGLPMLREWSGDYRIASRCVKNPTPLHLADDVDPYEDTGGRYVASPGQRLAT